ncbi:hypothetical protein J437_LFUL001264 [Ladona fulva]|uniref:DDE Tnp4 domain-containing protein n=1 Tax=Ladona fulva TaxID=123851 RepID=A0A8K0JTH6_LADFU|nr:hypothetical protein J437_LFUL001264 [Ladona fulva]
METRWTTSARAYFTLRPTHYRVARRPGSCHDARILDNSSIRARIEEGVVYGILLGDSGYPCRRYLMTPVLRLTSRAEEKYNRVHIKTRNIVERAIGVWKQRFPCLRRGMGNALETTAAIISATAVLHNIAVELKLPEPEEDIEQEEEVENILLPVRNGNAANARELFIIQHLM